MDLLATSTNPEKDLATDAELQKKRIEAENYGQMKSFKLLVIEQGWSPSEAIAESEKATALTDETREKIQTYYSTKREINSPEKMAQLRKIYIAVDKGEMTAEEVDKVVMDFALTKQQERRALEYVENGGQVGSMKYSEVQRVYKQLTGAKDMPDGFFEDVGTFLEPGKPANEANVRRAISTMIMSGNLEEKSWYTLGLARKGVSYSDAVNDGKAQTWTPSLASTHEDIAAKALKASGIAEPTEAQMQDWWMKNKMQTAKAGEK